MTDRERFAKYFEELDPDECWIWTGRVDRYGYGKFRIDGRDCIAHRVAYTFANGEIPDGDEVDHTCRTSLCVNPAHLEAVSGPENRRRQWSDDARQRQRDRAIAQHAHGGEGFGSLEPACR